MLFPLCLWAPAATEVSLSCSQVPLGSSGYLVLQLLCPMCPNAASSSPCAQLHASLGPTAQAASHKPSGTVSALLLPSARPMASLANKEPPCSTELTSCGGGSASGTSCLQRAEFWLRGTPRG